MIEVTKIVINFQKVVVAIAKAFLFLGSYRCSDEWDEMVENAFEIFVLEFIKEKYGNSIDCEYEVWVAEKTKNSLLGSVCQGANILAGEKEKSETLRYKYKDLSNIESNIEFSFMGFGNPCFEEDSVTNLNYVLGVDKDGRRICAKIEDCRFFIEKGI